MVYIILYYINLPLPFSSCSRFQRLDGDLAVRSGFCLPVSHSDVFDANHTTDSREALCVGVFSCRGTITTLVAVPPEADSATTAAK